MEENKGKVLVVGDGPQHAEVLGKLITKLEEQRAVLVEGAPADAASGQRAAFELWRIERLLRAAKRERGWDGQRLPRPQLEVGQELTVQFTGGDFHDAVLGGRPARESAVRVQRVKQDGRATLLMYPVPTADAILWGADFQWRVLWVKGFKVGVRPMLVQEAV